MPKLPRCNRRQGVNLFDLFSIARCNERVRIGQVAFGLRLDVQILVPAAGPGTESHVTCPIVDVGSNLVRLVELPLSVTELAGGE